MELTNIFNQSKPALMGNDLAWLNTLREKSLVSFLQQGFPDRHQENWKYTDLSFLNSRQFEVAAFPETLPSISSYCLKKTSAYQIVFIDGYFSKELSQLSDLSPGIKIMALEDVLKESSETIRLHLQENTSSTLADFNTAFMRTGVFIHIPANIHLDAPIHCLFISTQTTLAVFKNFIVLEPNSSVVLLEEYRGRIPVEKRGLCNEEVSCSEPVNQSVTNIVLKENAALEHYKLQQESLQTVHLSSTTVAQSAQSTFKHYSISIGSKLARDDLQVSLNESHAACELIGFYNPKLKQHIDHHTRIDHNAPECNSFEYYKGILNDQAKGVFNGKVIVHPQAQKTRSRQVNKNLLLATTAEMNTKPELEIYADDVECTHGATVGQIDPEALFYMQSRGINQPDAFKLLTQAFCDEVLDRMENNAISKHIREKLG